MPATRSLCAAFLAFAALTAVAPAARADGFILGSSYLGDVYAYNTSTGSVSTILTGLTGVGGITIGPGGDLYVAVDTGSSTISQINRYTRSGTGLGTFTFAGTVAPTVPTPLFKPDVQFSAAGTRFTSTSSGVTGVSGSISYGYHLAVGVGANGHETLYVTDINTRVYAADLTAPTPTLSLFVTNPNGAGGLTVDGGGNVYVTETGGIRKFSSAGADLGLFGTINGNPFNYGAVRGDLAYDPTTGDIYSVYAPSLTRYRADGVVLDAAGNPAPAFAPTLGNLMPGSEFIAYAPALPVPEPSLVLLAAAGLGLAGRRARRRGFAGSSLESDPPVR